MMDSKIGPVHRLGHYIAYLLQYKGMLDGMVSKDFKGRFKYTALGYFWHVLNPLSQILIYYLIFTVIFGRDIPNYWVYISTGMFAFTFAMGIINDGARAITNNSRMVTKMAFAREILVIAKAETGLITLTISYILLAALMVVTGVGITWNILFVPVIVIALMVFCLGIGFVLSAVTVYMRDIANAVSIIMGCMMFAIPIMYLPSQRATDMMELLWNINPLYYYNECIHSAFYYGTVPDLFQLALCLVMAPIMLAIGLFVFKKLERGFAERL